MEIARRRRLREGEASSCFRAGQRRGIDLGDHVAGAAADVLVQQIVRSNKAFEAELGQALAHHGANDVVRAVEQLDELAHGHGDAAIAKLRQDASLNLGIGIEQGADGQRIGLGAIELRKRFGGGAAAGGLAALEHRLKQFENRATIDARANGELDGDALRRVVEVREQQLLALQPGDVFQSAEVGGDHGGRLAANFVEQGIDERRVVPVGQQRHRGARAGGRRGSSARGG